MGKDFKLDKESQIDFEESMSVISKMLVKTMDYFKVPNYIECKFVLNNKTYKLRFDELKEEEQKQFLCGNEYRNKEKRCLKQCGNCQGNL